MKENKTHGLWSHSDCVTLGPLEELFSEANGLSMEYSEGTSQCNSEHQIL